MRLLKFPGVMFLLCGLVLQSASSFAQEQNPFGTPVKKQGERRPLDFYGTNHVDPNPVTQTDEQRSETPRKRLQSAKACLETEDLESFFEEFVDPTCLAAIAAETGRTIESVVYDGMFGATKGFTQGIEKSLLVEQPSFLLGGRVASFASGPKSKVFGQTWVYLDKNWKIRPSF